MTDKGADKASQNGEDSQRLQDELDAPRVAYPPGTGQNPLSEYQEGVQRAVQGLREAVERIGAPVERVVEPTVGALATPERRMMAMDVKGPEPWVLIRLPIEGLPRPLISVTFGGGITREDLVPTLDVVAEQMRMQAEARDKLKGPSRVDTNPASILCEGCRMTLQGVTVGCWQCAERHPKIYLKALEENAAQGFSGASDHVWLGEEFQKVLGVQKCPGLRLSRSGTSDAPCGNRKIHGPHLFQPEPTGDEPLDPDAWDYAAPKTDSERHGTKYDED